MKWLQPSLEQYSLANQVQASAKVLQQVVKSDEIPVLLSASRHSRSKLGTGGTRLRGLDPRGRSWMM